MLFCLIDNNVAARVFFVANKSVTARVFDVDKRAAAQRLMLDNNDAARFL